MATGEASTTAGISMGVAVSRGVNPILTAIPGLTGTYAWPQITVNAGGQIVAITSLTTFTGVLTINGQINATNTAGGVAGIFSTPSDTQVQINASGTGQFSTLQFTQAGAIRGQLFSDNTNGFMELTVNNGTSGFKISQGSGPIVGRGPVAGAFVDMTPDTGTFTGTLTGMTGATTGVMAWSRVGNLVTLVSPAAMTGTSNSASMTMTGLPAAIQSARTQLICCLLEDDADNVSGAVQVTAASGTITFLAGVAVTLLGSSYLNYGASSFSTSGIKGLNATTFSYLLN